KILQMFSETYWLPLFAPAGTAATTATTALSGAPPTLHPTTHSKGHPARGATICNGSLSRLLGQGALGGERGRRKHCHAGGKKGRHCHRPFMRGRSLG